MSTKKQSPELRPLVSLSYLEYLLGTKRDRLQKIATSAGSYYQPFDIHKKGTDKWRHIDNPQHPLKTLQKRILKNILNRNIRRLPDGMTGGISGRSIVENAKIHIGKECIGVIDIKNCFPSTNYHQINQVWIDHFGCGYKTANLLTKLTTFQHRLPQGAPTSPLLCNFALAPVFGEIKAVADSAGLDITIFIDYITVSGSKKSITDSIEPIIKILVKHGYAVRKRKVKVITSNYSQKVTGIPVNRKLSIGRGHIQQIRNLILETASLKGYIPSNDYCKIQGKISFAKSVSKTQGVKLGKFAEKMLVHPLMQVGVKKDEASRDCKRFSDNHKYTERN